MTFSGETVIIAFELSGYRYGVLLTEVRELLRIPTIVPLPKAPAIVEGVVNIRGAVVPVMDVRTRFRLPKKPPQPADHLVVTQAGPRVVALRVDRVLGLEHVDPDDIQNPAAITPRAEYLAGVAKHPDGLVLIHDLGTFLADAEARDLDEALDNSSAAPS